MSQSVGELQTMYIVSSPQMRQNKINTIIKHYPFKCENFIVLGDFNVAIDNSDMPVFCDTYDLKILINLLIASVALI